MCWESAGWMSEIKLDYILRTRLGRTLTGIEEDVVSRRHAIFELFVRDSGAGAAFELEVAKKAGEVFVTRVVHPWNSVCSFN